MNTFYDRKLAWIFGGSEGIGLAVARDLTRAGAHVVVLSRSAEKLASAQRELESLRLHADQILRTRSADVTQPDALGAVIAEIGREQGAPDFVINCAGFSLPGFIEQVPWQDFEQMIQTNYLGTACLVQAVVPMMMQRGSGHIVTTSSIAGFLGVFGYSGYCASKFAVIGFSDALRHELKPYGIRVSVLCPPNTRTPGLEQENKRKPPEVLAAEEKITVVDPERVAHALLRALPRGRFMVIPTADGWLTYGLKRYAPWLVDMFLRRPKPKG